MESGAELDDSSASVLDALRLCAAKGDEERFVGLVLTARVLPFHPQPDALLRRALEGCGLAFLERLLRTPSDSSGAAGACHPLALKLLARRAAAGPLATHRGRELAACALGAFQSATAAAQPAQAEPADGDDGASGQAASAAERAADALQLACELASDPFHALPIVADAAASLAPLLSPPLGRACVEGACAFVGALADGLRPSADGDPLGAAGAAGLSLGMHGVARALALAAERADGPGAELRLPLLRALCLWLGSHQSLWAEAPLRTPRAGESAAPAEWLGTLRRVLGAQLSSRLPPAARADALEACAAALRLFGDGWTLPQPADAPLGRARAAEGAPTSEAEGAAPAAAGLGGLANLLVQLSAVELAMQLRADVGNGSSGGPGAAGPEAQEDAERVRAVLACAAIVEHALYELHADAGEEEAASAPALPAAEARALGGADGRSGCWVRELDDGSLLAIHRAVLGVVETAAQFAEDLREQQQQGECSGGSPPHPLAPVAARLLAAWLVQPSAAYSEELHRRVRNVSESLLLETGFSAGGASPPTWACVLASSV